MTKRWSSVRSDLVTTKRATSKAARRAKIDDDDTNMTNKIHPAIEAVARAIFNEQFEGVSSYHGNNPVAVTWDNARPTLKVEYLHIAKTLIRAFLDATRAPSQKQIMSHVKAWASLGPGATAAEYAERQIRAAHDQQRRELGL